MKRLALTFLSTAAVCAVVSATPAAAQNTVTGAPSRLLKKSRVWF